MCRNLWKSIFGLDISELCHITKVCRCIQETTTDQCYEITSLPSANSCVKVITHASSHQSYTMHTSRSGAPTINHTT